MSFCSYMAMQKLTIYLSTGLNLVAFLIIVLSYASMFYNIQRTGTQTTKYSNHIKKEVTIAKRFFSIVITDSLCWIPIFILKILSLLQVEIPGTVKCYNHVKEYSTESLHFEYHICFLNRLAICSERFVTCSIAQEWQ